MPDASATHGKAAMKRAIVGSGCSNPIDWHGGLPAGYLSSKKWPAGTVVLCWRKYQLADKDDSGDYYRMEISSEWTQNSGGDGFPAEMHQTVTSSAHAKNNVFTATRSFTSQNSCSTPVSYGLDFYIFSISVSPQVCSGYGVSRYVFDDNEAYWKSPKAGGLRYVETTFAQKVPEGVVPKFDVTFAVPRYDNTLPAGSDVWKSEKDFKWVTYANK